MSKRWLLLSVVLCAVSCADPVFAQTPPVETIPAGDDRIVPMSKGQAAPFEGQLFEPATALRWANWLQQYKLRLKVDVEREQKMCAVQLDFSGEKLRIEREKWQTITEDYRKRLLESEKARAASEELRLHPPFFESPVFYYGLGVVTVGVISGLTIWGVSAAN